MDAFLLYILKSGICLTVFYVCFKALFSNDTFFRFNRWILLVGTGVCMLLPLCRIQTARPFPLSRPVSQLKIVFYEEEMKAFPVPESKEEITIPTEQRNISVPWTGIIGIAFLTGSGICLTTTILSFGKMYQLTRKNRKLKQGKYTLILTPDPVSPFSWGRYIFLSENDYRNHPNEILMHEKMHLRYNHSVDLIYMKRFFFCNGLILPYGY